jgi:hypothetical protein
MHNRTKLTLIQYLSRKLYKWVRFVTEGELVRKPTNKTQLIY